MARLDWSRFKSRPGGTRAAFETFTAQLFERWLRRDHGPDVRSYVLHGAGGDGGVEAFAELADGSVVGLQAKWFPGNLTSNRIQQINSSLEAASQNHPRLEHFAVALPRNLTTRVRGRTGEGGIQKWERWRDSVEARWPHLRVELWDEARQLDELAAPGNEGLYPLWFEKQLTQEALEQAWNAACGTLRDRYLPELHAQGEIEEAIELALLGPEVVEVHAKEARSLEDFFSSACTPVRDLALLLGQEGTHDAARAAERAAEDLDRLALHARRLSLHLQPEGREGLPSFPENDSLRRLEEHLDDRERTARVDWAGAACARLYPAIKESHAQLAALHRHVAGLHKPHSIVAPAGYGKTHALADMVRRQVRRDLPAVFLQANQVASLADLLRVALDRPSWSLAEMLDGLEALAIAAQRREASSDAEPYHRALLVLDGLEEAPGWERWRRDLEHLRYTLRDRPRILFVTSMRPETADQLRLTPGWTRLRLSEAGRQDLPVLTRRYCEAFDVDLRPVPWLPWALRSPLEVRLMAEEYQGGSVSPAEGIEANLLGLFRRRLARAEEEARETSPEPWSAGLSLLVHVLEALVEACATGEGRHRPSQALLDALAAKDPEFTASRVRHALEVLRQYGLVDRIQPISRDLTEPICLYSPATRHVADFVVARQAYSRVLPTIDAGKRAVFPEELRARMNSTVLFAAMLAEEGHFIDEDLWEERPESLERALLLAGALLPGSALSSRKDDLVHLMTGSTERCQELLRHLVIPVARIPEHAFGPRFVDEVLRSLTFAAREKVWSIPGNDCAPPSHPQAFRSVRLPGVLDSVTLNPEVDAWDGLPLLLAWTCSSVIEARRIRAREELAVWGSRCLSGMARLVDHMSTVDDPQVIEDVIVAAFGAALGAEIDDSGLLDLAELMDELYFAHRARTPTPDVIVRQAARGIVERAALIHSSFSRAALERARPPYSPKGPTWPEIDAEEARQESDHYGGIVTGDLSWYVADRCFRPFSERHSIHQREEKPEVDRRLLQAVASEKLDAPSGLLDELRQERARRHAERDRLLVAHPELEELLRERRPRATGQVPDPDSDACVASDLFVLQMARGLEHSREGDAPGPRSSKPYQALLHHAADLLGPEHASPVSIRNGMIAAWVRRWGWAEQDWEAEGGPDDRVLRRFRRATHGERSAVATPREKLVWAAVNHVAGELADCLPIWEHAEDRWELAKSYEDLGTGHPDPLPRTLEASVPEAELPEPWMPAGLFPVAFIEETSPTRRADLWLRDAPLPDPREVVAGSIEGWREGAVLSLHILGSSHQGCVDESVEVHAFATRRCHLERLRRDIPHLWSGWRDWSHAVPGRGVYDSPAVTCWAPWLRWEMTDQGHMTFGDQGDPERLEMTPLTGEVTTRFFDEDGLREPIAWLPAPVLSEALGVVGLQGGHGYRIFEDRRGLPTAIERSFLRFDLGFDHHYLAVSREELSSSLAKRGMTPVWLVRSWREASTGLWMRGTERKVPSDLSLRAREVRWLVYQNPTSMELEFEKVADRREGWTQTEGDATSAGSSDEDRDAADGESEPRTEAPMVVESSAHELHAPGGLAPGVPDRVANALFGKTRRGVLNLLLGSPTESRYLSEIVEVVGTGLGAVRRELENLVEAGLLVKQRSGRRVYYRANVACPVFPELRAFVGKTSGIAALLRDVLQTLGGSIQVAFLFGSVARGEADSGSDVDLFVIGRASFREVVGVVSAIQTEVGREINPVVMTAEEFQRRLDDGDRFIEDVLEKRREFVFGADSDIEDMAREWLDRSSRANS